MALARTEERRTRRPRRHPTTLSIRWLARAAGTLFAVAGTRMRWLLVVDAVDAASFASAGTATLPTAAATASAAKRAGGGEGDLPPIRWRGSTLIFRVEGSRDDPEFVRACGVVKGLEELYGRERYLLHPVLREENAESSRNQQYRDRRLHGRTKLLPWLPRWLCGSWARRSHLGESQASRSEPSRPPRQQQAVLCSIYLAPDTQAAEMATAAAAAAQGGESLAPQQVRRDEASFPTRAKDPTHAAGYSSSGGSDSGGDDGGIGGRGRGGIGGNGASGAIIPIGGVEDLLEFVRSSVLAGPRPLSFAFHEQSLRMKEAQRRDRGGVPLLSTPPTPASSPSAARRDSGRSSSSTTHSSSNSNVSAAAASSDAVAGPTAEEGVHSAGAGLASAPDTYRVDGAPWGVGSADAEHGNEHGKEGDYDYDLVVIGGGSGGLACAKEAARLGKRVACLDFVKPSALGTTWGLGGTCVNVGCIPKKLMHQASLLAGHARDAPYFGWRDCQASEGESADSCSGGSLAGGRGQGSAAHDWSAMVQGVQNFIKGLNFKYRTDLRSKGVEYINALGRLEDGHSVVATAKNGKERVLSCAFVVVAVGGRPKELPCEGGELAITSDDIFSVKTPPGKTLVVGASYVALECAGFLTGLGVDTTVMVRSILLRGFDQGIAERIGSFMEAEGTRFLRPAVPHRISKTESGRLLVAWREGAGAGEGEEESFREEEFDTVLAATGRRADTRGLGLESLGVALSKNGKMVCRNEQTTVPSVFGLGDAVEGVPELTPAAVQAGRLLAMRLFGGSARAMDYGNVCTTVFTPLEYGCCGLSEDEAIVNLGEENVEVYHSAFTPLEWQLNPERSQNACYVKAVCDLTDNQRVLGLHFLGPNAGEVMQGFGVGIRLGMTFDDLQQLVGIHPTAAEELTLLQTTKRSGEPIDKSAC